MRGHDKQQRANRYLQWRDIHRGGDAKSISAHGTEEFCVGCADFNIRLLEDKTRVQRIVHLVELVRGWRMEVIGFRDIGD